MQSFCYCGELKVCKAFVIAMNEVCAKLLLLWRMKNVCKALIIVEIEEYVQSFCYCRD